MAASITQEDIKLQNRRRILSFLRRVREATRREIAQYGKYLIPQLQEAVALGGSLIMDRDVSIRVAKLSRNAPVLGAAFLSFSERYI